LTNPKPLDQRLIEKPRDFVYNQVILTAQAFARIEASSGIVLMLAAIVALLWANSPWDESYFDLLHTELNVDLNVVHLDLTLQHWVNDGLMTIFFFLMGLEIKRELVHGELSSTRRALLPMTAALGGMIVPALIYTAFNAGGEGAHGWGVPVATDIAFALGVLSLLSQRVPFSIKIFLLALAIADDIGGILVIAIFYTSDINFTAMGIAALILAITYAFNRAGVRTINIYIVLGGLLWLSVHESGIHATIGGVVLGLMTPAMHYYNPATFAATAEDLAHRYRLALQSGATEVQESILAEMEDLTKGTESPLERIERALVRWVGFAIVPIFALANAGVAISGDVASDAISSPVSQGVALGLVLGKPAGIFIFTFLAVKLGLYDLPRGATWPQIFGVGMLGGIGFTVALLITDLGFREHPLLADEAKLGVLAASAAATVLGLAFLYFAGKPAHHEPIPSDEARAAAAPG
jgi:NhaA family Na+:H+ antiporter